MKSQTLATELRRIVKQGGGFGSDTELALNALADAFDAQPDKTVAQLVAKMKPRAKAAPKSKEVTFDTPPTGVVADFVERLLAVRSVGDAQVVLNDLSRTGKSSLASADEVKEIAGRYLGAKLKFGSKAAAIAAVKERFDRDNWDSGVIKSITGRANL